MIRRLAATATAVLLISTFVVAGATVAGAKVVVVTASGSVHCGAPGSGTGTVAPPFKSAPSAKPRTTKSTLSLACTGTTTNALVTPTAAKIVSKSVSPASATTCTTLQSTSEAKIVTTTDIKWTASGGKINPTHIVFSSSQAGTSGSTLPGPTGTATITGSYAGGSAVLKAVVSNTLQQLASACLSKAGLKKLNFGASSSLQINQPGIPATGRYSAAQFAIGNWVAHTGIQYTTAVDYTGTTIPLLLDVYTPPPGGPASRPTILLIHGGAFVGGGRGDMVGVAQYWVARGYNAVSIDYRLDQSLYQDSSPPKEVAAATNATLDGESAVRWMKANAATYGIDVNRIAAVGYSAGGAISLGLSAGPDLAKTGTNIAYSSKIAAAVSTGAYLTPAIDLGALKLVPGLAPILMFHYETDVASNTGPYAFRTCTAYRASLDTCEYVSQPGEGHTTDLTPGSVWWSNEVGPFIWHYLHLG